MNKYEELREQTEAADGEELSRLGRWSFLAYRAGEISYMQMLQLDDVWNRRVEEVKGIRLYRQPNPLQPGELKVSGTLYPEAAECLAALAAALPEQQVIPIANLHRLDLKPGDRLAVILPDGIVSARDVREFAQRVQDQLDECAPDLRAIVFPPGTQLDVVSAGSRTEPRGHTYPVGGLHAEDCPGCPPESQRTEPQ